MSKKSDEFIRQVAAIIVTLVMLSGASAYGVSNNKDIECPEVFSEVDGVPSSNLSKLVDQVEGSEFYKLYSNGAIQTQLLRLGLNHDGKQEGNKSVLSGEDVIKVNNLLKEKLNDRLKTADLLDQLRELGPDAADIGFYQGDAGKRGTYRSSVNELVSELGEMSGKSLFLSNGPFLVGKIKGVDSRQLSRSQDASRVSRDIFWTVKRLPDETSISHGTFEILAPRISVVYLDGKAKVIESLIPDREREIWIPKLYEYIYGKWFPVNRTSLGDDLNKCVGCHGVGRKFGPTPFKTTGKYEPAKGWFFKKDLKKNDYFFPWVKPFIRPGHSSFYDSITQDPDWAL